MKRFLIFAVLAIIFSGFSPLFAETNDQHGSNQAIVASAGRADSYLPQAAKDAIDKSQAEIRVNIPKIDGSVAVRKGQAFLVSDDGLIVTALHILPAEADVVSHTGRILFSGMPAKLLAAWAEADIALLKLESVPDGMKPVAFAKDVSLYSDVFAKISLVEDSDNGISVILESLPFRAKVVNIAPLVTVSPGAFKAIGAEFLYLDKAIKNGFSGSLFVNEKGEAVGMGKFIDSGYSGIVSASSIQVVLGSYRASLKKNGEESGTGGNEANDIKKEHALIDEMLKWIDSEALDRPKNLALCVREMRAMRPSKECRDRFTRLETPDEAKISSQDMQGEFGGIGVELTERDGAMVVVTPLPDSPAIRAGILPGDIITHIDGKEVKSSVKTMNLIRGPVGKEVRLTIRREKVDKPIEITIVREKIVIAPVKYDTVNSGGEIVGVIRHLDFGNKHVAEKVGDVLEGFRKQGIKKVVFNLRNNPGGLLVQAAGILAFFMDEKDLVLTVKWRAREEKYSKEYLEKKFGIKEFGKFRDMEVVVLINGGSASASEIVAGTLQDWGRKVVGEKSFGKGFGQTGLPLSDGSVFYLTTFEFLVGNKKVAIKDHGVLPDVAVENKDEKDLQFKKAMEILTSTN